MSQSDGSAWAPLRHGAFRALWLGGLASNVGLWMQTVGAQWLVVHRAQAAILVPLVQVADQLPDLLFGLVGGVLADIFDRWRLLIAVQLFMTIVCAGLAVLTKLGHMPPALLLTFTFVLGAGSVLTGPAYQSLIPDLVPRSEISSAASLGSISINISRAIGPAIAGVLISLAGVSAVFAVDTAVLLFYGLIVVAWRAPARTRTTAPEPFVGALYAGARYVRNAPVVRRMLLRATLFLVPGSALWALLPLVATQRLGLGSGGYGVLLGALGIGAVAGAFVLPLIRAKLSPNALIAAASCCYAAALVAVVVIHSTAVVVVILLPTGVAWIAVLSTMNALLQLFLPSWVRARGISIYLMVLFGSQALGAVLWGALAAPAGVRAAFLVAAGLMLAGAATTPLWPLIDTRGMGRNTVVYWPEPQLVGDATPGSGPVVVETRYTIASELEQQFLEAMSNVRQSRLRTGASQWGLFRDGESEHVFVEFFVVPTWEEHLRQHTDRQTEVDQTYEEQAMKLSDPPPETSHLISTDVHFA